jgi:hypothetical protein
MTVSALTGPASSTMPARASAAPNSAVLGARMPLDMLIRGLRQRCIRISGVMVSSLASWYRVWFGRNAPPDPQDLLAGNR